MGTPVAEGRADVPQPQVSLKASAGGPRVLRGPAPEAASEEAAVQRPPRAPSVLSPPARLRLGPRWERVGLRP